MQFAESEIAHRGNLIRGGARCRHLQSFLEPLPLTSSGRSDCDRSVIGFDRMERFFAHLLDQTQGRGRSNLSPSAPGSAAPQLPTGLLMGVGAWTSTGNQSPKQQVSRDHTPFWRDPTLPPPRIPDWKWFEPT